MAACLAAALFLGACSGGHGTVGATDTASGNGNPAGAIPVTPQASTAALFQPLQGILPYPTDLYFAGSTDGTLNIQPENALMPNQAAINSLDGFSTTAVIRARFGGPLDPASFTAQSVLVLQVTIDNTTKATTNVVRPLVFGVDYTTGVGPEAGVGNTILEIRPTHPLVPSTGATNNGYLVLLTKGITDSGGKAATADTDYATIKAALPTCSTITDTSLHAICQLTGAHLQIAHFVGLDPADVVLSFSFSTQSISDTLAVVQKTAAPQPLIVHNTKVTTAKANPQLSGHATLYVGTLSIPYYLSRTAPLTGYWQGNPSPLDAGSRFLTRFNPAPVPTETLQIPVLVTVPNANSAGGGVKPASGKWPVLIYEHGITRNRTDMLAVADSFADSGFVVVAIDLPLHGVTDPTSQLYASGANPLYAGLALPATGSIERTFDLDVVNNTTGAPAPDGQIDASGASFVNLASVLTTRDNLREAAADLITLTRSLPNMNLDADPAGDIDPAGIHYLGHSLGAIVGGVFLGVASQADVSTATLAMPGGGLAYLLRDSPTLGPRIVAGLEAQGLMQGTTLFEQFFRDAQTIVDSGDPLNYIAAAATHHPIHVLQIAGSASSPPDQVVPNSATQRLIDAAALARIAAPAAPGPVTNASGFRAYVNFVVGDHGSIIDPRASLATTTEMQAEAIAFAGAPVPPIPQLSFPGFPATAPGSAILILNPGVIQQ
ncbi:MAG: Extracellular lipase, Pla/cef family [Gammaproteobacteria bacterium]|nr:Extracellular lipase, Pla/cef family [Gammaproteobacteria bacterium]